MLTLLRDIAPSAAVMESQKREKRIHRIFYFLEAGKEHITTFPKIFNQTTSA
jgi:hypothetical protein